MRHAGRTTLSPRWLSRAVCWPAWCRKQRKYLLILTFVSLFVCLHLLAHRSSGLFETDQAKRRKAAADRRRTNADDANDGQRRLNEIRAVALGAPPSSRQDMEFPLKPFRPLQRVNRGRLGVAEHLDGDDVRSRDSAEALAGREDQTRRVAPFPWPERKNVIPNYYLSYGNASEGNASVRFGDDSVLVYLHHNKAAGTTTKKCLLTIAKARPGRSTGPVLSGEGRLAVESRFVRSKRFRTRTSPNTYFGGYAFGICDRYTRPCAYFTVMRDPYERTLSSHSYCKHARPDQLCSALEANSVPLREWAIHQGSFFFRQLLFQPEFCSDRARWISHINLAQVPHQFLRNRNSLKSAPCWFRQKLIMELTLNQTQHDMLLQYCLANLERWFAVIMMVDHYDESLLMAQEAFKLPMHDLCTGRHDNSGSYNKTPNTVTEHRGVPPKTTGDTSTFPDPETQLAELRRDPEVRMVLRADELLYQKGLEIFQKQRDIFKKIKLRT